MFHKALKHGVLIDFENLDDPATKYLQFPYVVTLAFQMMLLAPIEYF